MPKAPLHVLKWVEIELSAIRSNVSETRRRLDPRARLMAVVKADAYGHGAAAVSREALKAGAACLGVLTAAEAAGLRRAGVRAPIQILSPDLPENSREIVRLGLTPTVDNAEQARALAAAAPASGLDVHVDVDFGLGRWGAPPRALPALLRELKRLKRLRLAGLSTHIDYVPGKNSVEAEEKLWSFSRIASDLRKAHPGLVVHAANSSVLMDFPHWQFDQVRIGNLLYGINPASTKSARLSKPWSFRAHIVALHDVRRGQPIGYASEYIAPRGMRVATLPVGYSDGLTMEPAGRLISLDAGKRYWGMLKGTKTPFIGRVGISHVLVDVTDVPSARVGDAVTLPLRRTAASAHLPRVYI